MDPVKVRDQAAYLIARQLFEPLVKFDRKSFQLVPGVATSWSMEDGGARWIFKIRPKVAFHSGNPLTTADVVFSLNRLASKSTASELSFLLDQIVGFEAVNGTGTSPTLEGLRVVDESTVEIRLKSPWVEFPYVLTHPATAPISSADLQADPEGFTHNPVGAGPYRLAGPLKQGQDVELVVSKHYFGKKPKIKRVTVLFYDQLLTAWRDFDGGDVDITQVAAQRVSQARAEYGSAGFAPLAAGIFIAFNAKNVPDVRVRKAISLAIDRRAIAHSVYDDLLMPPTGLIPEGLPGSEHDCAEACLTDIPTAIALVKEAFPQGAPPLPFEFQTGTANLAFAESIRRSLENIGITVQPLSLDVVNLVDALSKDPQAMFRLGWVAEYPLADWFTTPLFRTGSPDNRFGFSSPEIDELLSKARAEPDQRKRLDLYRSAEAKILESFVIVPVGQFRNHLAAGRHVHGFYSDPIGGFEIARLSID